MKPLRTIAVFPTLLTLGNLVCGFFAIVVAARIGKPELGAVPQINAADLYNAALSGWLIFLAMVFDGLDGYVARLSRTSSDFGAQLDSLCDCVTFGVAPAFLLVKMCPRFTAFHSPAVWIIAASYAACAALRLARFNVETSDEDEHLRFNGLPSPAGAAALASFAIMQHAMYEGTRPLACAETMVVFLQYALPFLAVFVALRIVSRIPYAHRPCGCRAVLAGGRHGDARLRSAHCNNGIRVVRSVALGVFACDSSKEGGGVDLLSVPGRRGEWV